MADYLAELVRSWMLGEYPGRPLVLGYGAHLHERSGGTWMHVCCAHDRQAIETLDGQVIEVPEP